jgi:mRNA interferase MazF
VALAADAKSGLAQPSWAMVDKITTVRAKSLTTRVGQVTGKELKTISANAAVFLGLAG